EQRTSAAADGGLDDRLGDSGEGLGCGAPGAPKPIRDGFGEDGAQPQTPLPQRRPDRQSGGDVQQASPRWPQVEAASATEGATIVNTAAPATAAVSSARRRERRNDSSTRRRELGQAMSSAASSCSSRTGSDAAPTSASASAIDLRSAHSFQTRAASS